MSEPAAPADLAPYDALLLVSFGGPESPADVLPFLRNVTAGRGIPDERLAEVAQHYHHFGGRSPINDQNRALLQALRADLGHRGLAIPVYWGNRNWSPYLVDALRDAHEQGARRVLAIITSAYSSYSGCRQYRENLADALGVLAREGRKLGVDRVRQYFNHPSFAAATTDAALAALAELPAELAEGAELVFVTHSIPAAMAAGSGAGGNAYEAQHRDLAAYVAEGVRAHTGRGHRWELVFCSRSGAPRQPWLEPDVGDYLRSRAAAPDGPDAVVLVPIGFVSDHLEVAFDLDTEAMQVATSVGLPAVRAATVGVAPRFVRGLVDLAIERAGQARGETPVTPTIGLLGPVAALCPAGCCPNPRADRPAACGADWVAPPVSPRVAAQRPGTTT